MADKQPMLLTVIIQTKLRRWFVAGIALDGQPVPLMCSEPGNLDPFIGVALDEQVNFLRHRLSGVLQRGCDRLWGRQMKPRHIVFVTDAHFEPDVPELTQQVADHFVIWMTSPPVVFYTSDNGFPKREALALNQLAGELSPDDREVLAIGLPRLMTALEDSDLWELASTKKP